MLFNSLSFLIFFPIVVLLYYVIPKKQRYLWLLVTSYYFYMNWNPKYALLIAFSTIITYLSGLLLENRRLHRYRKLVVAWSFIINIGILIGFKYFDFIFNNINSVLSHLNLSLIDKPFDVILPVGISFYTFQALSYTVDVYRGDIAAEKNLLRYALFVSFFPQLVAGPIERSVNLLTQIQEVPLKKCWNYDRVAGGLILMVWGLFQKMVIADRIAIMVNRIFDEYYLYQSAALLAAAVGFAIQIYCDFASYSTIAVGASQVMGFSLIENFNTPYFASGIQDFWRRWHISLSEWFRDYLYIPLGGSRCSKLRHYGNLMITFLVSGLWHGASWNYVVWGGLHGAYQIIGKELRPLKNRMEKRMNMKTESFSYRLGQILVTFILTDFAWIFFRSNSIRDAFKYIYRIATRADWWSFLDGSWYIWAFDRQDTNILWFALLLLFLVDLVRYTRKERLDTFLLQQCLWFRWLAILILLFGCLLYGSYGIDVSQIQFLYFQF